METKGKKIKTRRMKFVQFEDVENNVCMHVYVKNLAHLTKT